MTKNSSSKAAIAQIRTRLSAVGIEMNYSTALRLYDAAGEGPRRITKAMAIGIVDHSVNTADGLEDTADRTSRRFEPWVDSIATIGTDRDDNAVHYVREHGRHLLVYGEDASATRKVVGRLTPEASLGGAQLVVVSANGELTGLKHITDQYAGGLQASLELLNTLADQVEDRLSESRDEDAQRIVLVIEGLGDFLRPESYMARGLRFGDPSSWGTRREVTERNMLRAQCAELIFAITTPYSSPVSTICTTMPHQVRSVMEEPRWRHFWRDSARLVLGPQEMNDHSWLLRHPLEAQDQMSPGASDEALYEPAADPAKLVHLF